MKKLKRILWYIQKVDIIKFLKYNYLSSNVVRAPGCFFYPLKGTKMEMDKSAKLELQGNLTIGNNKIKGSKRETYLLLREDSQLCIKGDVVINYGSLLQVHSKAVVTMGKTNINTDVVIIAEKEIEIGSGVLIGRQVTIFDSDFHAIHDAEGNRTNMSRKVTIGNHVWIGTKATILKGTKIKDGAVISANALVGGIVKEKAMFSALPGQMFGTVEWR